MKTKLKIKFVQHRAKNGQHYFTIVNARNGKVIATSETYTRLPGLRGAIRSVAHGLNSKLDWEDYAPTKA